MCICLQTGAKYCPSMYKEVYYKGKYTNQSYIQNECLCVNTGANYNILHTIASTTTSFFVWMVPPPHNLTGHSYLDSMSEQKWLSFSFIFKVFHIWTQIQIFLLTHSFNVCFYSKHPSCNVYPYIANFCKLLMKCKVIAT